MRDITRFLSEWLAAGGRRIGQILLQPLPAGWELRHVDDQARTDLPVQRSPEAARFLANLDDAGAFRPLKTAPTLAHGWCLHLADVAALREALDYLYPAMAGVALSQAHHALPVVPLRGTLGRQTGMYRVTQKITDEQARATVDRFCAGCLKQRLWEIDGPNPQPPEAAPGALPLLCPEACNLLVAEIRQVVKNAGA